MELIDEEGFLFGKINIIDAFVILLVLAVIVSGVGLLLASPDNTEEQSRKTQVITFESVPVEDFVAESIQEGSTSSPGVIAIREKEVTKVNDSYNIVRLRLELPVTTTESGLPLYRGNRLYLGKEMRVDLGPTIIEGVVVEMEPIKTSTP